MITGLACERSDRRGQAENWKTFQSDRFHGLHAPSTVASQRENLHTSPQSRQTTHNTHIMGTRNSFRTTQSMEF